MDVVEDAARPPWAVADLVRPLVRSWEPQRVLTAELTARCLSMRLKSGESVVTLSREDRCVLDGPNVGRTFTSWVVGGDDQEACELLAERCRAAGAQDSPLPAARLLGSASQAPVDIVAPSLERKASAGDALRVALARDLEELLFRLVGVPLDEDPEDVHRARVVTRRLRGMFRTFGRLLQIESAPALLDELAWFGDQLGPVRDTDVMLQRLEETCRTLTAEDRPAVDAITARLKAMRKQRWDELIRALRLPRCVTLLDGLVTLASEGLLLAPEGEGSAGSVLTKYTRKRWRRLKRRVERMPPDPSEADLHRFRIAAKRTRYACEIAALDVGEPAALLAGKVSAVQDVLGAHQDAVVLRDWLRQTARENHNSALAASELAGIESARMAATGEGWREVWDAADRKRLRRWMRA
jgi:CHAD domain-containing protein